jgi:proteasome lid subunit RPN8/RPN11
MRASGPSPGPPAYGGTAFGGAGRLEPPSAPGCFHSLGRIRIAPSLARELVEHAIADLPNECCGMIAGVGGAATRVLRAANTESSPFMYVMDPREQLRIMDEIEDSGEDLLAIYHSHTRSAAYPSRTDVELAFFPDTLYLIVSIADRDAPQLRAFRIRRGAPDGEQIAEEPVEIE